MTPASVRAVEAWARQLTHRIQILICGPLTILAGIRMVRWMLRLRVLAVNVAAGTSRSAAYDIPFAPWRHSQGYDRGLV